MTSRPYVLLSCASSLDGYLDDATDRRLVLSNDADWDRVDEVRASCDAILVGANTIRRDNPRLLVRSAARRRRRVAEGRPESPVKVTITASGDLDPSAAFFATGEQLVYAPDGTATPGETVPMGERVDLAAVLADLAGRGVARLMVEGGTGTHTAFLTAGLADELHLAIAPFFVGDSDAPRFVHDGRFPWHAEHRATLVEIRAIGNVALHRYLLSQSEVDRHWLRAAIELSTRCPPSETAFAVGAIVVDAHGDELARGWSRESGGTEHAEEAALAKLDPADPRLAGATIYSSLEPCGRRASRPRTCTELILAAGIPRVVFALREPPTFVDGRGAELLAAGGVEVVELPDLAPAVREVNRELL
ncbi:MAG: dihydrofolate reductase family protein [Actinophytocola sp.]|uniref:dihydrofolate reductase family protein n=1 Tax=Actinophytocola sp. TaxID=1872138 RepID=UPI003D6B58D3